MSNVVSKKTSAFENATEAPLETLKVKFRLILRAKLKIKYGRIPTNKQFANDFNSISNYAFTISNETARKWVGGVVIPRGPSMQILSQWLGVSLGEFDSQATFQNMLHQNDNVFEHDFQLLQLMSTFKNLSPIRQKLLLDISNEFFSMDCKKL